MPSPGSNSAPNGTNARSPPAPPARTPRRETHRVLYDFVGQNENEVTMKRGEHVLVTLGDTNGWSLVKMEAGVRWAPSNYLAKLEPDAPPIPREPASPVTTSSGSSPTPSLPCDQSKRNSAECKRTPDGCSGCNDQYFLCRRHLAVDPTPSTSQWFGRSARTLFVGQQDPQICIACRVRIIVAGEDFCSRCKIDRTEPVQRLPTSCYIPEKGLPRRAMKVAPAQTQEPQFNELHLVCGPCQKANAHCTGFPSHICKRCNDKNIDCQITLKPAVINQIIGSNTPKKARGDKWNSGHDAPRKENAASSGIEREGMALAKKEASTPIPDLAPLAAEPAGLRPPRRVCEDCKANGDEHDPEWPSCTSCEKLKSSTPTNGQSTAPLAKNHPSPQRFIRKNVTCCLPAPRSFVRAPAKQEPLPDKAAGLVHLESSDKLDPKEPREQDRDGDEWEWIEKLELEDDIDIVVIEPEPQSAKY